MQKVITFSIDSISNPGTFDATYATAISTIDESGSQIDVGDYTPSLVLRRQPL